MGEIATNSRYVQRQPVCTISSQRLNQGISTNNLNREQAYLCVVFNELHRLATGKKKIPRVQAHVSLDKALT